MNELVSVIVPVYNVELYLRDCIESILSQTYCNLEIILVDDGTPDSSGTICDEYLKKDARVKVIHKSNGGLSDARNAGLMICTGQYISFVDADDMIHPQMIEFLYKILNERTNVDIAVCDYSPFSRKEQIKISYDYQETEFVDSNDAILYMLNSKLRFNYIATNKLYRRAVWDDMQFPYGLNHEDMFVIPKIVYRAKQVGYCRSILYYNRENPNSITRGKYSKKSLDELTSIEEMRSFFVEENLQKALFLTNRIYLWRLIDHTAKSRYLLQENAEETSEMVYKKYKGAYKECFMSTRCTLLDKVQFTLCYFFPKLFFKIKQSKYLSGGV